MLSFQSVHDSQAFYERKKRGHLLSKESMPFDEWLISGMLSDYNFHYDDMPSHLLCNHNGTVMDALGGGPSNVAAALRAAVASLEDGDGRFQPPVDDYNYGLHLRFTRTANRVAIERVRGGRGYDTVLENESLVERPGPPLAGPSYIDATWDEFIQAVDAYNHWHLTEHVVEAPWLLRVPVIQQWRSEAGLPPDRL